MWLLALLTCRIKCKYSLHRQGAVLGHGELWVKDHCRSQRKKRVPRYLLCHTSVAKKKPPP